MQPLSVGNVVSAGLRIYRDHFQLYYGLAFQAYLWLFVPIYGWAKFAEISALISRLAFCEVIERPETLQQARSQVNRGFWQYFLVGLLVMLILVGAFFSFGLIFSVVFGVGGGVLIGFFAYLGQQNAVLAIVAGIIGVILVAIVYILFLIIYLWFYSRLSIPEVVIAVENLDASASIGRSWQLTEGNVMRLQLIYFITFLIMIPLTIVIQVVSYIVQISFEKAINSGFGIIGLLYFIAILGITFGSWAVFVPLWQTLKAVIYYDLRSRREGLDLQIRDR